MQEEEPSFLDKAAYACSKGFKSLGNKAAQMVLFTPVGAGLIWAIDGTLSMSDWVTSIPDCFYPENVYNSIHREVVGKERVSVLYDYDKPKKLENWQSYLRIMNASRPPHTAKVPTNAIGRSKPMAI